MLGTLRVTAMTLATTELITLCGRWVDVLEEL
jgi:hypothetical protein